MFPQPIITRKLMIKGLMTYVPGVNSLQSRLAPMLVGESSLRDAKRIARYKYSIWLRHLVYAYQNGVRETPRVVAELGPGLSLGIGLAALLSGAEKYYALDIAPYAKNKMNAKVFNELIQLFDKRTPIPDDNEFSTTPLLDSYDFPHHILTETCLEGSSNEKVAKIKDELNALPNNADSDKMICYVAPWNRSDVIRAQSVDMILSQAVMEHIDDLNATYRALSQWLKPCGLLSEAVDFRSHGIAIKWNGHWAYSDFQWKLIRGKRPFLINREPCSTHTNYFEKYGLKILCELRQKDEVAGVQRGSLSQRFQNLSPDDFTTQIAFFQCAKSGEPIEYANQKIDYGS
jgi:SAM-dependent methyltransferase